MATGMTDATVAAAAAAADLTEANQKKAQRMLVQWSDQDTELAKDPSICLSPHALTVAGGPRLATNGLTNYVPKRVTLRSGCSGFPRVVVVNLRPRH